MCCLFANKNKLMTDTFNTVIINGAEVKFPQNWTLMCDNNVYTFVEKVEKPTNADNAVVFEDNSDVFRDISCNTSLDRYWGDPDTFSERMHRFDTYGNVSSMDTRVLNRYLNMSLDDICDEQLNISRAMDKAIEIYLRLQINNNSNQLLLKVKTIIDYAQFYLTNIWNINLNIGNNEDSCDHDNVLGKIKCVLLRMNERNTYSSVAIECLENMLNEYLANAEFFVGYYNLPAVWKSVLEQ